jgi:hypothetical protein
MSVTPKPMNPASAPTEVLRDSDSLTTDELRGGTTGNHVRYILIFSLAGALIALGAAWFWVK